MTLKLASALVLACVLSPPVLPAADTPAPSAAGAASELQPSLQLGTSYDDNLYATSSDRVDDFVSLLAPRLQAKVRGPHQSWRANLGANLARHWQYSSEDYNDYWFDLEGRWQAGEAVQLFAGAGYEAAHEERDSADALQSGSEPTTYAVRSAQLGLTHRQGDYLLRLGGTLEQLRYDATPVPGGEFSNADRDRDLGGLALRLSRRVSPQTELFAQLLYDQREYRNAPDVDGYVRDSSGYRTALGFRRQFGAEDSFEAYLGYLRQDYEDGRYPDVGAPDFAAKLVWQATPAARIDVLARRSLLDTTQTGAAGDLYSEAELQLEYRLGARWLAQLGGYYGLADYQGMPREDRLYALNAGLHYELSARWFVAADYGWTRRDSNDQTATGPLVADSYDYTRQRVSLTLGGQF
jgi:hypothetical protein